MISEISIAFTSGSSLDARYSSKFSKDMLIIDYYFRGCSGSFAPGKLSKTIRKELFGFEDSPSDVFENKLESSLKEAAEYIVDITRKYFKTDSAFSEIDCKYVYE